MILKENSQFLKVGSIAIRKDAKQCMQHNIAFGLVCYPTQISGLDICLRNASVLVQPWGHGHMAS
jgi:hypothetical protein